MLPDCECKGRAFLHSLQEITEKNCEKISFAPILPLHSIAKSAVKPIFSPLPHPSFFAPKSPFFPLFPVSNPISGDFSGNCSRFLTCEVLFFLALPRFEPDFGRFFDGPLLFSAPKLTSSLLFPVLPHTSGTSSRDLTLYFLLTPLFAQREGFSDSVFPFLHHLPHLYLPIYAPSPLIHPTLHLPPPLFFSFLPTFPSPSPTNTRSCAPSRTTRDAYACTYPHVRRFSFIAFTASPTSRNSLYINALGVKENEKKPSQNTQPPHYQQINYKIPISSAVNPIYRRGEPKKQKPSPLTRCATTT